MILEISALQYSVDYSIYCKGIISVNQIYLSYKINIKFELKNTKIDSLIYFLHRLNYHIQDQALYNGRMLRKHFAVKTKQKKSRFKSYTHSISFLSSSY